MQDAANQITKEHPDLYKRSSKGVYWILAIRFVTQILGFVKSVIVFNFLFRQNLELIIIANLLVTAVTTFSESGFSTALIQKRENIHDFLNTAWVVGILRSVAVFAVIYIAAPFFAAFKVRAEDVSLAVSVIRVIGFCVLIGGFQNIGTIFFQKEIEFHKIFLLTVSGAIIEIVLSIVFVVVYKSVWGCVGARIIATMVNILMTYWMCPFRPKFQFIPAKARELWKMGKWLSGANIVGYLLNEGDNWFVLMFFPIPEPLKLYSYGYNFATAPATHFSSLIAQVSLPAYSKIQNDLSRLCDAHVKILQATAMISIPMACLIFALSPDFVRLFLVEESGGMVPVIQILSIVGLITSLGASFGSLYTALGKPHIGLYTQSLRLVLLVLLIYPLTSRFGIIGTAVAVVLVRVLVFPIGFYVGCRLLNSSPWVMAKPLYICLFSAILMTIIMMFVRIVLITKVNVPLFFILGLGGTVLYLVFLWVFDSWLKMGYRTLIIEQISLIVQKAKNLTAV